MYRFVTSLTVVFGVLFLFVAQPNAQGEPEEPVERVWRSYSLDGIPLAGPQGEPPSMNARANPIFPGGQLLKTNQRDGRIIFPNSWGLEDGIAADGFIGDLDYFLRRLEDAAEYVSVVRAEERQGSHSYLLVQADKAGHEFVSMVLDQLRAWFSQRAGARLYRLDEPGDTVVVEASTLGDWIKRGELVGVQRGTIGETLVWRQVTQKQFTTDYERFHAVDGVQTELLHSAIPDGWEVCCGMLPIGPDRLWVQACVGSASVDSSREFDANGIMLSAPRGSIHTSPLSIVIERGTGVIIDRQYLLVPEVDGVVAGFQQGPTWVGPANALVRCQDQIGTAWPGDTTSNFGYPAHPEWTGVPTTAQTEAADGSWLEDVVEDFDRHHDLEGSYIGELSPFIVIHGEVRLEEHEKARDTDFEELVKRLNHGPDSFVHHVRLYAVDAAQLKEFDLPANADRLGSPIAHFPCASVAGQQLDWEDLSVANYFAGGIVIDGGVVPSYEPEVAAGVAGTKFRFRAERFGDATRVELTGAHAPTLKIAQNVKQDADSGLTTERAEVSAAHLRIVANLQPGESEYAITPLPGDESKRLVMVVTRQ